MNVVREGQGDAMEELTERFQQLVSRLRSQRVNTVKVLDLENMFKCVYTNLGCPEKKFSACEFAMHMESCKYGKFAKCLIPGCQEGTKKAFLDLNEIVSHYLQSHKTEMRIFSGIGLNAVIEIPVKFLTDQCLDFVSVVGVIDYKAKSLQRKIITFVKIVYSEELRCACLVPFSICLCNEGENGVMDDFQVSYKVSSLRQLEVITNYGTLNGAFSKGTVYSSLRAYLEDGQRDNHVCVPLDANKDRISRFMKGRVEIWSFTISAVFEATRM